MRGGILLVSNYSNRTGYAWNNIYRLFEVIALQYRSNGYSVWVSFDDFDAPLDWPHRRAFDGVLQLAPAPKTFSDLLVWLRTIRRHNLRYLYLTDHDCWHWRYALFRVVGIRKIIVHCRVSVADPRPALPSKGPRAWLKGLIGRIPLLTATRVYAVSHFVRDRLVKQSRFPSSRVVTILNGVDLKRFYPAAAIQESGRLRIFSCGRATKHKGIQVLIEAAAILRDQHCIKDFEISYAGEGPDLEEFRAKVNSLGLERQFIFLGQLNSTDSMVRSADIIVVPSIWGDACPSSISEALGSGKPLVATRVGGVPEMIGDEGAAIIVEPNDPTALASALAALCQDKDARRTLGRKARRRAELALDERRYHSEVLLQLSRDIGVDSVGG